MLNIFCCLFQLYFMAGSASLVLQPCRHMLPSGILCVYKPKDWSSNDMVTKIRVMLEIGCLNIFKSQGITGNKPKVKVGHGGTLDPLAEGVLVLGIGEGTKLMSEYLSGSKGYHATAVLGTETDTLDCTGKITETVDCSHISNDNLELKLSKFRGDILQVPPMYSALKRDGKKLYELARQGIEVEREARPVSVYNLELCKSTLLPSFELDIECSGGFYVRTLIADLARSCEGRAHMTALIRTKQGQFSTSDCLYQSDWNFGNVRNAIISCSTKAGINVNDIKPAI